MRELFLSALLAILATACVGTDDTAASEDTADVAVKPHPEAGAGRIDSNDGGFVHRRSRPLLRDGRLGWSSGVVGRGVAFSPAEPKGDGLTLRPARQEP